MMFLSQNRSILSTLRIWQLFLLISQYLTARWNNTCAAVIKTWLNTEYESLLRLLIIILVIMRFTQLFLARSLRVLHVEIFWCLLSRIQVWAVALNIELMSVNFFCQSCNGSVYESLLVSIKTLHLSVKVYWLTMWSIRSFFDIFLNRNPSVCLRFLLQLFSLSDQFFSLRTLHILPFN